MNRREAISALMALPVTATVTRAKVKPNDVIVIEYDGMLTDEQTKRIAESVQACWPDNKVAVIGGGLRLRIAEHA